MSARDPDLRHAQRDLIDAVRQELAAAADPQRAPGMQAYMKSALPFYGVPAPRRRRLLRAVFARYRVESFGAWRDTLLALWREATHREEWYAALDFAALPRYQEFRRREALPLYEELVVIGAWWDVVDEIAAHRLGELLRREPRWMAGEMRRWARADHLWKRRAAVLCQLRSRDETDLPLLYDCIEPNLDDPEWFMRKAIGWALRAYARSDPDEVVHYVRDHADRLSPLSTREALKNVRAAAVGPAYAGRDGDVGRARAASPGE